MEPATKNGPLHDAPTASREAGDISDAVTHDSGYGSIAGGVCEFGRTYHLFKSGSYLCPNDDQEHERLDMQHAAFLALFSGKLHLAPLSTAAPPRFILDVGSGSGIWAIDMADEFATSEVIGVDLSPTPFSWSPPNTSFYVDDARERWSYGHQFGYIHTRNTLYTGCWSDFKNEIIQQAFDNLEPGGWFESQEVASLAETDDGTLSQDGALSGWINYLNSAGATIQRPRDVAHNMAQWYKEVGFADVQQRTFKIPLGSWAKDPHLKESGIFWLRALLDGLSGLSLRLFNVALGWSQSQTEAYLVNVRKELMNKKIHAYSIIHVVYGRRPFFDEVGQSDNVGSTAGGSSSARFLKEWATAWNVPRSPLSSPRDFGSVSQQLGASANTCSSIPLTDQSDSYSQEAPSQDESLDTRSISEATSGVDSDNSDIDWLHQQQRELVNRIVQNLCLYLDSKIPVLKGIATDDEQSHSPSHSAKHNSESQSQTDNRNGHSADKNTTSRKRPVSDKEDHEGKKDGDDGDNRRRKKRNIQHDQGELEDYRKFACPYYKRNPRKYCKWTSCPGPGWNEVHRVKGHLYRRHALPPQCPRCWETFSSDGALTNHLQHDHPCVKQENPSVVEGFTKEQEKQLRSRKKTRSSMAEEDKWREVYRVLFPDDDPDCTPNPYYEAELVTNGYGDTSSGRIEDYAVFLRREMPSLVRRELEAMFQAEFHDIGERLRPRVEQIVLELQPRLMRFYQESTGTSERGSQQGQTELRQEELSQGVSLQEAVENQEPGADPAGDDNYLNYFDQMWFQDQFPDELPAVSNLGFACDFDFEKLIDPTLFN